MTTNIRSFRRGSITLAVMALATGLVACGGSGGSSDTPSGGGTESRLSLSGIAASSTPLAGQAVGAACATGSASGTTGIDGSYSITVDNGAWPCLVRVSPSGATALHSVALGSGTSAVANLTPATQLIVARLAAGEPAAFYSGFDATEAARVTADTVATAQAAVVSDLSAMGLDLSSAGDLITQPAVTAGAYQALLAALIAALTQAGLSLEGLAAWVALQASNSGVASLPPGLLLKPAAASCPSLRSGSYRIVRPVPDVTFEPQTDIATIDVRAMTIVFQDGVLGTLAARSGTECFFDAQVGELQAQFTASPAGVLAGRLIDYSRYRIFVGFPEQTASLADLKGDWNRIGMSARNPGEYAAYTGRLVFDDAGKITASEQCATGSLDSCSPLDAAGLAALAPASVNPDGGFDLGPVGGNFDSRLFAYRSGGGDTMLVSVRQDGGFSLSSPVRSYPLPSVGHRESANWNFDTSDLLDASAEPPYQTENTVTAVDAATGSWTQTHTWGGLNPISQTVYANLPRPGYTFRPAATARTTDTGTEVYVSEYTDLAARGMSFGMLDLTLQDGTKLFEFWTTSE